MNENVCRLCRKESNHLESLLEIRDGLPLSVLIMIICPIKIEASDLLPKLVCGDCSEIVLNAYRLRDESIKSDRYFRDCMNNSSRSEQEDPRNQSKKLKTGRSHDTSIDYTDDQSPAYIELVEPKDEPKNVISRTLRTDLSKDQEFPYEVECFKKGVKKSPAWDYFGRLVDQDGEIVDSEDGFYFCKICVAEKKSIKRRYKSDNISTGMIFQHLKAAHGFGKEMNGSGEEEENPKRSNKEEKPVIQGLTFACPEGKCEKVYKLKMCLDIHLGLEHTGIADEESSNSHFHVRTSYNEDLKSMAWKYFGALLNADYEVIDDDHNYCQLCVRAGNVTGKYVKSCSTTTLLHHLRDQHLTIQRKRKRFGKIDLSSISKEKQ